MAGSTWCPDEQDVSEVPAGAGERDGFGGRVLGRFPGAAGGRVRGGSEPGGGLRDACAPCQPHAAAAGSGTLGLSGSEEKEEEEKS